MTTHLHEPNGELLVSLNYKLELFKSNPSLYYPEWKPNMIATDVSYIHPIAENGVLREKTRIELIEEGIEELNSGEKIESGVIIYEQAPVHMLKPEWNGNTWLETATPEEIESHNFNKAVDFYNSELNFASKATAELACEIITEDMYADVKAYMQAIDPYAPQTMRAMLEEAKIARPEIFDRYKGR